MARRWPSPNSLRRPTALRRKRSVAHRRVRHELADLLAAAARGGYLRRPLLGRLPRRQVEDGEASVELPCLRVRAGADRPVTGHHDRLHVLGQPAPEHPHACVHGLLGDGVSGLSYCGQLLAGDVVHRAAGERNQVSRHLISMRDGPHTGGVVMSDKKKSARSTSTRTSKLLSDEERAAMKETLKERRRALSGEVDGEGDVLAKIAEMPEPDRGIAKRLHAVIKASAPTLSPKTWYGMPAYAKDGKVVCFFQSGQKFKSRYATLGFQDAANLDDGDIWPTSFALKRLTAAVEEKIGELVKRAAS